MIISHQHQFIFFAVPKTGTHAIRRKLQVYVTDDDWEQENLFHKKRLPIPELAEKKHGHITVKEIQSFLATEIWKTYYKFGIVRNPYDRFVSICFFIFRKNPNFLAHPIKGMKHLLQRPQFKKRTLALPQTHLLLDGQHKIGVNYFGKYENLQDSFDQICTTIGLPQIQLDKANQSDHQAYSKYYDEELSQMVYEFYQSDFEHFGYSKQVIPSET